MENTPTKIFMRSLYENTESRLCVRLQCNQSVFDPFYKRILQGYFWLNPASQRHASF